MAKITSLDDSFCIDQVKEDLSNMREFGVKHKIDTVPLFRERHRIDSEARSGDSASGAFALSRSHGISYVRLCTKVYTQSSR